MVRLAFVRRDLEIGEHHAKKDVGPKLRVDEAGVFPDPAEPTSRCEHAFLHRAGIHVVAAGHRPPRECLDSPNQRAQPIAHDLVVVVASRVASHAGSARNPNARSPVGPIFFRVHQPYRDHAPGPFEDPPGIHALLHPAGQVLHRPRIAPG